MRFRSNNIICFQEKEWLCLTCQMQRAVGGMEPPGATMTKPQPSAHKVSLTPAAPQKDKAVSAVLQKDIPASQISPSMASQLDQKQVVNSTPSTAKQNAITPPMHPQQQQGQPQQPPTGVTKAEPVKPQQLPSQVSTQVPKTGPSPDRKSVV